MDQARIDLLRQFHTGGQPETMLGWSQANDAIQEWCLDTIERLQKERDQLGAGGKVWQRTAGQLKQERDAALAEVERLKGQLQAAETSIQAHRGFVRS